MRRFPKHLLVGGLVIASALVYLAIAAAGSNWTYYTDVDQFVAGAVKPGQRVRLHGRVQDEGAEFVRAARSADFELLGASASIRVEYRGAIPELFGPGREVVVEGFLGPSGVFTADVMLTKCASKYEPGERAAQERRP